MHVREQVLQFFIKNADFFFVYVFIFFYFIRQGLYGGIDGVVLWPLAIPFLMYIVPPVNITAIDFVELKLHVHCFTE